MGTSSTDVLWVLFSACLVFLMQAGFLCLETGFTRSKNNINVAIKNIANFGLSSALFWAAGYALMFGRNELGIIGTTGFFPSFDSSQNSLAAFFIFQVMFCGTAVTIMSGAIAERLRFNAYLLLSGLISLLIYPLFGHWVWNGIHLGAKEGWLGAMGFVDFAGGTVVHSIGGWASLAVLLIIGPRMGRYTQDEHGIPHNINGANIPVSALGMLLLFLGWFGFNGGSHLGLTNTVVMTIVSTLIGGCFGLIGAMCVGTIIDGYPSAKTVINGTLSGLVAVTAGVHAFSLIEAALIAFIGGCLTIIAMNLMDRFQIDDAIGAVPVHLVAGIWGTLAVGIFGDLAILNTGLSRMGQIGVQALGVITAGLWAFSIIWIVFSLVDRLFPLRVSPEAEFLGLNITEHGMYNELAAFLNVLDRQSESGDLTLRAPVEPYTEIGRIADSYNRVIDRLEQVANENRAVVDGARDGIITFAVNDLNILLINPAAERLFGVSAAQARQQSIESFVALEGVRSIDPILKHIVSSGQPYQLKGTRPNGTVFPVEIGLSEGVIDHQPVYIATFRDISERQQVQQELEHLNDELTKSNRYKDQFMAAMSHELRTPLNAILGMSEALMAGVYGEPNRGQDKAARRINDSGRHLLELIDDILDLSKISAGQQQIDKHQVPVQYLCETSLSMIRPMAAEKEIELVTRYDDKVHTISADARRFKQILINLLNNAVKFTPTGGKVGLMIIGTPEKNQAHIIVWDTGIGIPEDKFPQLFQPFVQLDGTLSRKYGGTGLGLALVERLVKLHEGKIRVTSEEGKGSRFIVTLPWQAQPEIVAASAEPPAKINLPTPSITRLSEPTEVFHDPNRPWSILLAEDNEANIATLADYLSLRGYSVSVARNGAQAVEMVDRIHPDIILMDIQMPQMDGMEAIRQIRINHTDRDLPIIALTALAMPGDRERCLRAGASDYLSKPIALAQLVQTIEGHLADRAHQPA